MRKHINKKKKANKSKRNRLKVVEIFFRLIFLKVIIFVAITGITGFTVYYIYGQAVDILKVEKIVIRGNKYLSEEEIIRKMQLGKGDSILGTSSRELREKIIRSPWIEDVIIRKELPNTVMVNIVEVEPFAILRKESNLYLIGDDGHVLERLDYTKPLLPLIETHSKEKEPLNEALKLIKVIKKEGFFPNEEIEVLADLASEITLRADNLVVKVGKGDYRDKLLRFSQVEREIASKNISIDFIDLRFDRRVIVKPKEM